MTRPCGLAFLINQAIDILILYEGDGSMKKIIFSSLLVVMVVLNGCINSFLISNLEGTWQNKEYNTYYGDYLVEDMVIYNQEGENFYVNFYDYWLLEGRSSAVAVEGLRGTVDRSNKVKITYSKDGVNISLSGVYNHEAQTITFIINGKSVIYYKIN